MSTSLRHYIQPTMTQYISLAAFSAVIFNYTASTGSLAPTGVSSSDAAALVLLRDTGRRLSPATHAGVLTPMISVGFVGASSGLPYAGFIDPTLPGMFSLFTGSGSIDTNPVSTDLFTSGVNTSGNVSCAAVACNTVSCATAGIATLNVAGTAVVATSAGVTFGTGTILTVPRATGSASGTSVAASSAQMSGVITFTGLTLGTSLASPTTLTITGLALTTTSRVFVNMQSFVNGLPIIFSVSQTSSTITVLVANAATSGPATSSVTLAYLIVQ